jgi:uncharacterized protein YjeT (DUF2065 family)
MRRLTGIELAIVILALVFIIAGADMLIRPTDRVSFHHSDSWPNISMEHVSKGRMRFYGFCALLVGSGLAWMVVYNARK